MRAAAVDARVGRTGLFMCLLTIYSDASEALHGTLYGAVFHLGAYDPGSVPEDEQTMQSHHCQTLSMLYLMCAGAIDDLLKFLDALGEAYAREAAVRSGDRLKSLALDVGLVGPRKQA